MMRRLGALTRHAARIEITIALALAAGALALAGSELGWRVGLFMAAPAFGLFINLCAALVTNRTLSARPPLFAFHVGLAVLALSLAADAMTSFSGHVEIANGGLFNPAQVEGEARPWHRQRLSEVAFLQKSFDIAYAPGMKRRETRSVIETRVDGARRSFVVGDDHPLIASGYRFYTSFNKGFAPLVTFTDAAGIAHTGAVHLPSYPLNEDRQANTLRLPAARGEIVAWLDLEKPVYDEEGAWRFAVPEKSSLVVISGGERRVLAPGESAPIAAGTVRYDGLTAWMGYTITANPFSPVAAAAALASILALAFDILTRLRAPLPIAPRQATEARRV
jgi:cytochrome c biogenesis protein